METVIAWHLSVVDVAADYLVQLCEATGMKWGPNSKPERFWFRPPELHVAEFIAFHLICFLLYFWSRGYYMRVVHHARPARNPDSTFDQLLGVLYVLCWLSQVLFKAVRAQPAIQLCWLFMPCHLITLVWAYVLLSKGQRNYRFCVYLATLASVYHWGPVSAAMFPDFNDHTFPIFERAVFILHHGMLVLTPVYWALRYDLLPMTWHFWLHATWVATLINVGPYQVISYISGLNLNYHLYPPPAVQNKIWVFQTVYYRWYVILMLIAFTIAFRLIFGAFNRFATALGRKSKLA